RCGTCSATGGHSAAPPRHPQTPSSVTAGPTKATRQPRSTRKLAASPGYEPKAAFPRRSNPPTCPMRTSSPWPTRPAHCAESTSKLFKAVKSHDDSRSTIGSARRRRNRRDQADHDIRILLAYARELTRPRPYRLTDLAAAAGMSISGVRVAYTREHIETAQRLLCAAGDGHSQALHDRKDT